MKPETAENRIIGQERPQSSKKLSFVQRLAGHLHTILVHKKYVLIACFRMGLYRQGIFHDMSKFSPTEFIPGVKYYNGHFSPNVTERRTHGYSAAWLHHKGRNRHHFEYWNDYSDEPGTSLKGIRMPMRYVAEMIADRWAACKAYHGADYKPSDAWDFYVRSHTKHVLVIHPDTKAVLEAALITMRDEGEEAAFDLMVRLMRITEGSDYTGEILDAALHVPRHSKQKGL